MSELPAEKYMVAYCPRAKDGLCKWYKTWWYFSPCILDEAIKVGQVIWVERYSLSEPSELTADEIQSLLQGMTDDYVLTTFELPNYHLKIKGIVLQPDWIQIYFRAICPRFIVDTLISSGSRRIMKRIRKLATKKYTREDLDKLKTWIGGIILPLEYGAFKEAYLAFIAERFPTWTLVT